MTASEPIDGASTSNEARIVTLTAGNARVQISTFGATLVGVEVPDAQGAMADVLLGFDSTVRYAGPNPACYGGTIGPIANRTDNASLTIAGVPYCLEKNDGPSRQNNLHSSLEQGLHKRLWSAEEQREENAVRLTCTLKDGELGLPGNRTFAALYALTACEDGRARLSVDYTCETDAPTFVNVTNHAYFNLSGHASGDALAHVLQIEADEYLALREDSVSTGEILPVAETPFDFRHPKPFGQDIDVDCEQIRRARGYDHCFVIRNYEPGANPRPALRAFDPASGRTLEVHLSAPGAHLYSGNWLDDTCAKDGATYKPRAGFAFEPEFFPDCAHHPAWPQPICEPTVPYHQSISWVFGTQPAH